jgi:hypothetical protein
VLIPGTKLESDVNERLRAVVAQLRSRDSAGGPGRQAELQWKMEDAAGFQRDSILLYIPSLKAQAKGIETGALDRDGDVITLGEHPAVEEDVRELLRKYANLWRLLVYVHPSLQDRAVGLSAAVDVLLLTLYSVGEKKQARFLERHERDIQSACWFEYIPPVQRPAAQIYESIHQGAPVEWSAFRTHWNDAVALGGNPEDLALYIEAAAQISNNPPAWDVFTRSFPTATELGTRVRILRTERQRAAATGMSSASELKIALDEIISTSRRSGIVEHASTLEQRELGLGVDGE